MEEEAESSHRWVSAKRLDAQDLCDKSLGQKTVDENTLSCRTLLPAPTSVALSSHSGQYVNWKETSFSECDSCHSTNSERLDRLLTFGLSIRAGFTAIATTVIIMGKYNFYQLFPEMQKLTEK